MPRDYDRDVQADAKRMGEDRAHYVAVPPVVLAPAVSDFVSSLVRTIDDRSKPGAILTGASVYTSCRGRMVRITVQEVVTIEAKPPLVELPVWVRAEPRTVEGQALPGLPPIPPGEMPIDPGIARYVAVLNENGIETDQSCQGGPGHPFQDPFVAFCGNAYEGHKAFAIAMTHGLPVLSVSYAYPVYEGVLHGPHWIMRFREADKVTT